LADKRKQRTASQKAINEAKPDKKEAHKNTASQLEVTLTKDLEEVAKLKGKLDEDNQTLKTKKADTMYTALGHFAETYGTYAVTVSSCFGKMKDDVDTIPEACPEITEEACRDRTAAVGRSEEKAHLKKLLKELTALTTLNSGTEKALWNHFHAVLAWSEGEEDQDIKCFCGRYSTLCGDFIKGKGHFDEPELLKGDFHTGLKKIQDIDEMIDRQVQELKKLEDEHKKAETLVSSAKKALEKKKDKGDTAAEQSKFDEATKAEEQAKTKVDNMRQTVYETIKAQTGAKHAEFRIYFQSFTKTNNKFYADRAERIRNHDLPKQKNSSE